MDNQNSYIINSTCFNKDKDCLFCCTNQGFIIFNVKPFRQLIKKTFQGGFNFGCIYKRSNLFFLVGTGINSDYPTNRIVIWDEKEKKKIAEISINEKIEGFTISSKIFIYSKKTVYIYDFDTLSKLDEFTIVAYSLVSYFKDDNHLICYPYNTYQNLGNIIIKNNKNILSLKAHSDPINKICISKNGKYIATCSNKGFLIKVFNSSNGLLLKEYYRGYNSKNISFIGFSSEDNWLICATEYSSLHLFEFNVNNLNTFNLFRERSKYKYKIDDIIIDCVFNEKTNNIYFNSINNIYNGFIQNNELIVNESYLLIINKDPFSLSPKYLKKNKRT